MGSLLLCDGVFRGLNQGVRGVSVSCVVHRYHYKLGLGYGLQ